MILYETDDAFAAVVCLFVAAPVMMLAATILTIRDVAFRRSWRQTIAVVLLVVLGASLVKTATTPRFVLHQLFTFRSVDFRLPEPPFVFIERFAVCPEGQSCESGRTLTETRSFRLKKMPDRCCFLAVVSSRKNEEAVDSFQIILNGKEVELPPRGRNGAPVTPVELSAENQISVQLRGAPGAHLLVYIFFQTQRTCAAKLKSVALCCGNER